MVDTEHIHKVVSFWFQLYLILICCLYLIIHGHGCCMSQVMDSRLREHID